MKIIPCQALICQGHLLREGDFKAFEKIKVCIIHITDEKTKLPKKRF